MTKALFLGLLIFTTAVAHARGRVVKTVIGIYEAQCEAGWLFPGGKIRDAGYRIVYINGELVKNYSVAFIPTVQDGVILAKLWAPGYNPYDAFGYSDVVRCIDPRPGR